MTISALLLVAALQSGPASTNEPSEASSAPKAAPAVPAAARQRLVLVPFRALEVAQGQADLLSEVALTEAARFKAVEVLGESDLAAMLGHEKQKVLLGCQEDSCMAEIGGAMGASWLLVGSVGRIGQATRVDLKLIDVKKAKVLARVGETAEGPPDRAIAAVQRGLVALLTPVAGPPAPPASRDATPGDAGHKPIVTRVTVRRGDEVLVRHFKNFGKGCVAAPLPEIRVTRPPTGGTVELRRGDYPVEASWLPGAEIPCKGKILPGLAVVYHAGPNGPSADAFHFQVVSGVKLLRLFEFEVKVEVE
jgi:TolB-like protein